MHQRRERKQVEREKYIGIESESCILKGKKMMFEKSYAVNEVVVIINQALTTSSRRRMKRVLAVEAEPQMSLSEPSAVSRL